MVTQITYRCVTILDIRYKSGRFLGSPDVMTETRWPRQDLARGADLYTGERRTDPKDAIVLTHVAPAHPSGWCGRSGAQAAATLPLRRRQTVERKLVSQLGGERTND